MSNTTGNERQAIGLVATETNLGRLAQTVVHANDRGYTSLVTYERGVDADQLLFVEQLGGHLVHPDETTASRTELCGRLERESQRLDVPIVVLRDTHSLFHDETRPFVEEDDRSSEDGLTASVSDVTTGAVARNGDDEAAATQTVVAIPAYNEEQTIDSVVRRATPFADEVIVVDDGSSDSTTSAAREANATVVEHTDNRGYGAALQTAFQEANRRQVARLVILDADGQHDPRDIPTLLNSQEELDADIVVGSRFVDSGSCDAPLYRLFGLRVINVLTNLSLGVVRTDSWVSDTQSGFRSYNERAIRTLAADETLGESMSASTDVLYHAHQHGYSIGEAGVSITYDVDNPSSMNPFIHGFSLVTNILNTVERERPLLTFGLPGVTLVLFGVAYTFVTAIVETIPVHPLGLTVTSIITMVGIISCFTALILHSLTGLIKQERYQTSVTHD